MSYDLDVYTAEEPTFKSSTLKRAEVVDSTTRYVKGHGWQIAIHGPMEVDDEDLPEGIEQVLPGLAFLTQIHIEGDAPDSAYNRAEKIAKSLAKEGYGIVVNEQEDTIEVPREVRRPVATRPRSKAKTEESSGIVEINVVALLSSRFGAKESGRLFLEMLEPSYSPEYYNTYEPIRLRYDKSKISDALKDWGEWGADFLWKRKSPKILGMATMDTWTIHDRVRLWLHVKAYNHGEVLTLFKKMNRQFGLDLAYIHPRRAADANEPGYFESSSYQFAQGLSTHDLKDGLPGLCWGILFGQPYKDLFGERLLSAPAHLVEDLGNAIYLQMTDDIHDVDRRRASYSSVKLAVREHLNSGALRSPAGESECKIPEFELRNRMEDLLNERRRLKEVEKETAESRNSRG